MLCFKLRAKTAFMQGLNPSFWGLELSIFDFDFLRMLVLSLGETPSCIGVENGWLELIKMGPIDLETQELLEVMHMFEAEIILPWLTKLRFRTWWPPCDPLTRFVTCK